MNFFISTNIDPDKYTHFLEQASNANFYHLLEWHQVLQESYNLTPYYVIAEDKNEIVGCIPLMEAKGFMKGKRLISLPLSHHVPILSKNEEISIELLKLLQNLQKNYNYIELRGENKDNFNYSSIITDNIYSQINLSTFESDQHYWDKLPQRARRDVRKGLSILSLSNAKNIQDFERIYEFTSISKKRQGAVAYPKSFFNNLHKRLLPHIELFTAYCDSVPLSSIMIFNYKSSAIYAYGGSSYTAPAIKYLSTDFIIWESIKEAFNQKKTLFDFGSSPKHHSSLIQFKEKWGPNHYDLSYQIMSDNYKHISREGIISSYLNKTLRIMPLPINKLLGPFILKEAL